MQYIGGNEHSISSNPTNNLNEKDEIYKIIKAFKKRDEKTLNKYINSSIGFYIIPGPGTLLHFEKIDSISFKNAYFAYHQFGSFDGSKHQKIIASKAPEYSCENLKWDRYGLFLIKGKTNIFKKILEMQILGGLDIDKTIFLIAKKIDSITQTVYLTEKNSDIIFGFTKINGQVILTYLDLSQTYCDI